MCTNSPDEFCLVCGEFVLKRNRKIFTDHYKTIYIQKANSFHVPVMKCKPIVQWLGWGFCLYKIGLNKYKTEKIGIELQVFRVEP